MAHVYELHTEVIATCLCCSAPKTFVFASASDQVVCAQCVHHLGAAKAERRDAEHVAMWARLYSVEHEQHLSDLVESAALAEESARSVAELTARVAQLTAIVGGRFTETTDAGVRELLENDVLKRAERNTELASRRIDRVMAVLWRLDFMHHLDDVKQALCSCGKSVVLCPEFRALEPERQALREWEARQLTLLGAGDRHSLPAEHPAVIAARGASALGRDRARRG